jgi:DNA-binding PadR family transcriptional regulator
MNQKETLILRLLNQLTELPKTEQILLDILQAYDQPLSGMEIHKKSKEMGQEIKIGSIYVLLERLLNGTKKYIKITSTEKRTMGGAKIVRYQLTEKAKIIIKNRERIINLLSEKFTDQELKNILNHNQ